MSINISQSLAQHTHIFYSFTDLIEGTSRPRPDLIIAWSLGVHYIPPDFSGRVFLVNPALDFCHTEFGWKAKVLQRMILQLKRKPLSVLESFAQQLSADQSNTEQWISLAQNMDPHLLVEGLKQLCQQASLTFLNQSQTQCLQGEQDLICPPLLNQKLCATHNIPYQSISSVGHEIFSSPWMRKIESLL